MATKECLLFREWYEGGGMGDTCILPLAHGGAHKSQRDFEWQPTSLEFRLSAETRRLQGFWDEIEDLVNEIRGTGSTVGRFIANELATRMEKHAP